MLVAINGIANVSVTSDLLAYQNSVKPGGASGFIIGRVAVYKVLDMYNFQ